jgi:hypothetical protein
MFLTTCIGLAAGMIIMRARRIDTYLLMKTARMHQITKDTMRRWATTDIAHTQKK